MFNDISSIDSMNDDANNEDLDLKLKLECSKHDVTQNELRITKNKLLATKSVLLRLANDHGNTSSDLSLDHVIELEIETKKLTKACNSQKNQISDLLKKLQEIQNLNIHLNHQLNAVNSDMDAISTNSILISNDLIYQKELNIELNKTIYDLKETEKELLNKREELKLLELKYNNQTLELIEKRNLIDMLLPLVDEKTYLISKVQNLESKNEKNLNVINQLEMENTILLEKLSQKSIIVSELSPLIDEKNKLLNQVSLLQLQNESNTNELKQYKEMNEKLNPLLGEIEKANEKIQRLEFHTNVILGELAKKEKTINELLLLENENSHLIDKSHKLEVENSQLSSDLNESMEVINSLLPLEQEKLESLSKIEALQIENKIISKQLLDQKVTITELSVLHEENANLTKELNEKSIIITKLSEDVNTKNGIITNLLPLETKITDLTKEMNEKKVLIDNLMPLVDENNNLKREMIEKREILIKLISLEDVEHNTFNMMRECIQNSDKLFSNSSIENSQQISTSGTVKTFSKKFEKLYHLKEKTKKVPSTLGKIFYDKFKGINIEDNFYDDTIDGIKNIYSSVDGSYTSPINSPVYGRNTASFVSPKDISRSALPSTELIYRLSKEIYQEIGRRDNSPTVGIRVKNIEKFSGGGDVFDITSENDSIKIEDPISKICHRFDFKHVCFDSNKNFDRDEVIVEDLGRNAISDLWNGKSHTLIAYGQTASGKTHSMFGGISRTGSSYSTGLVYNICGAILHLHQTYSSTSSTWEITLSSVEIYNEKLKDLLTSESIPGLLKIRENNKKQNYIENLSSVKVYNLKILEQALVTISNNRKVDVKGSHLASRSHVLIFLDVKKDNKFSKLTLVDLAGTSKTLPIGDQVNEGSIETSFIRKSLSVLSRCYQAQGSRNSAKKRLIPTRESLLTTALSSIFNALANVTLLITINPLLHNINETMATLNFAQQLSNCFGKSTSSSSDASVTPTSNPNVSFFNDEIRSIDATSLSDMSYLIRCKADYDSTASYRLFLRPGVPITIGRKVQNLDAKVIPDLELDGIDSEIDILHCILESSLENAVTMSLVCPAVKVYINGKMVEEHILKKKLFPGDRIIIGETCLHVFILMTPVDPTKKEMIIKAEENINLSSTYMSAIHEVILGRLPTSLENEKRLALKVINKLLFRRKYKLIHAKLMRTVLLCKSTNLLIQSLLNDEFIKFEPYLDATISTDHEAFSLNLPFDYIYYLNNIDFKVKMLKGSRCINYFDYKDFQFKVEKLGSIKDSVKIFQNSLSTFNLKLNQKAISFSEYINMLHIIVMTTYTYDDNSVADIPIKSYSYSWDQLFVENLTYSDKKNLNDFCRKIGPLFSLQTDNDMHDAFYHCVKISKERYDSINYSSQEISINYSIDITIVNEAIKNFLIISLLSIFENENDDCSVSIIKESCHANSEEPTELNSNDNNLRELMDEFMTLKKNRKEIINSSISLSNYHH